MLLFLSTVTPSLTFSIKTLLYNHDHSLLIMLSSQNIPHTKSACLSHLKTLPFFRRQPKTSRSIRVFAARALYLSFQFVYWFFFLIVNKIFALGWNVQLLSRFTVKTLTQIGPWEKVSSPIQLIINFKRVCAFTLGENACTESRATLSNLLVETVSDNMSTSLFTEQA